MSYWVEIVAHIVTEMSYWVEIVAHIVTYNNFSATLYMWLPDLYGKENLDRYKNLISANRHYASVWKH